MKPYHREFYGVAANEIYQPKKFPGMGLLFIYAKEHGIHNANDIMIRINKAEALDLIDKLTEFINK